MSKKERNMQIGNGFEEFFVCTLISVLIKGQGPVFRKSR